MAEDIENTKNNPNAENKEIVDATHEYDGIKELNNPAPFWIILIFLVTIGFSLVYVIRNFGYPNNGRDQKSEYEKEMAAAANQKANMQKLEANVGIIDEKQMIEAGAKIFTEKGCIACHGINGEGNNIGPNLTDNFWINGCAEENLTKIISEGKPEKGMTSFKAMLTEEQIKQVATFVLKKLVGSNPANAKAAQGEECK